MKILGELWKADVCAETMYIDNPKPAKQLDFAFDNGIPLIMWIGEDEIAQGKIKVKSLSAHEEYFIERSEMVKRVKELIVLNPVLMTQEEQKNKKGADAAAEAKEESKAGGAGGPIKAISKPSKSIEERLDEIESSLTTTQWLGGQKLSSLDRDACDEIL